MSDRYSTFAQALTRQRAALASVITAVTAQGAAAAGQLRGPGPIFLGMGASLSAAAAPVWQLRAAGIESYRLGAGDVPRPLPIGDHPVVAVSQSGSSAETLAVLDDVDRDRIIAVVNEVPSPIADAAGLTIDLGAGQDSYASTLGYTGTIAGLALIAEYWDGGTVHPSWIDLPDDLGSLETDLDLRIEEAAGVFDGTVGADFVAAGPSLASAETGALLFREVSRIPATGMSTRQYLHGPMESAGTSAHILIGGEREIRLARQLGDAGHPVLLLTTRAVEPSPSVRVLRLPQRFGAQQQIVEAFALQRLVRQVAITRDIPIESFVFHQDDTKTSPLVPAGGSR